MTDLIKFLCGILLIVVILSAIRGYEEGCSLTVSVDGKEHSFAVRRDGNKSSDAGVPKDGK